MVTEKCEAKYAKREKDNANQHSVLNRKSVLSAVSRRVRQVSPGTGSQACKFSTDAAIPFQGLEGCARRV